MKLKCIPEDFIVEERSQFACTQGPIAVYQLEKRSLGTPEAITAIVDRWQIPRRRICYGGLKDKHATTTQTVTIQHGPKRHLEQRSFKLTYLGQAGREFGPQDILGNRFTIVMRDMTSTAAEAAVTAAAEVRATGLPNYFDDQRFGSLGTSGDWIARAWCLGDYERALWLALAEPHPDDRSEEKHEKEVLREHWGRWSDCKAKLGRSHRRSIVTYLADKEAAGKEPDFRGAFGRINADLRSLYVSAYQSALWNRLLAAYLEQNVGRNQLLPLSLESGPCWMLKSLTAEQAAALSSLQLPHPSARTKLEPGPILDLLEGVMQTEKLELRELRIKYPRDSFFSKGTRPACIFTEDLQLSVHDDDLYPRRRKVEMSFSLPRGAYATILVKRLTASEAIA